ncbi:hypothetical protein POTOM_042372 [Populus tomentosa]|uniref:Sey1/RHD3-like three-helix bundle domain-containing protein n=1 Tax=Populus tomentosa TaxID=118781 RepID=A0A8X8CHB7_POPTO|nr:hypothetical protein POTOM_042372 [Populus tomentosa]
MKTRMYSSRVVVMKRLFKPCKKALLFVLRDHSKVEITALPHYKFQEERFKEQRFVHSIYPGGLVGDRQEVEPASGFPLRAEEIWKIIKDNRDLDLPAVKGMVATVRCEEIAGEKLKCFTTDEGWLKMKEAVQAGPVSGFGRAVSSILETYLSEYDREVVYFDQEVRNEKQRQLLSNALMVVRDSYDTMLMHLYSNTLKSFKTRLEQSQNVAAIHLCSQSCMSMFDQGCEDAAIQQSEWNASKFREKLICDMLSEMMAKYEKRITSVLAKRVESLLEAGERDTWASIRNLFECNAEAAVSEFSDAAVSFNLNSSEIDTKSQHLREHARNVLKMKAREAADAERVMKRMMDRFSQVLSHDENSISWYNWTTERKLDEVERDALSESLRILSIIAAIRFDEMPDQIENVLYSSLMDRTVPDPSLQNKFMRAKLDPLASDTWKEVSPEAITLLKPEDCKSLWMNFIEKRKPMVTGARSRQDGHRKTGSYAAAATPLARLENILRRDIDQIWAAAAKTKALGWNLGDYFNVEIIALPNYVHEKERFNEQVALLRQRFIDSISPGGLVGDRKDVQPASGFSLRAEQIWKTIKENKDLDLPALEVMVATFRCEQIAKEKLSRLKLDETWLAMRKALKSGPVSEFGKKLSSILENYLSP